MGTWDTQEQFGHMQYAGSSAKTVTSGDKKTIEVDGEIHETILHAINSRVHHCLAEGGKAAPMSSDRLHWISQHMAAVSALDAVRRSA
jgi:hypothetical protein